jgi:hypothetical protein
MDERDLEPEQAAARLVIDELRPGRLELVERGTKVLGRERDVMHARTATREEPTHRRVVASRRHQLDAAVPHEQRSRLDALLHERLAVLEPGVEEPLVRPDRLVEIGDGEADVVDPPHAHDAIGALA